MADVKVYNLEGKEVETLKLSDKVFKVAPNENLIKEVITAYLANRRGSYAHAKDRSEVRGGGKKPWKQKGTGRARHGSIRSPLWVGGGVTFGPSKERNYKTKINKKLKDKAMAMLLTDLLDNNELLVVDSLVMDAPKTKKLVSNLKGFFTVMKKEVRGKGLLVTEKDVNLKLASRNIPRLENIASDDLNPLAIINSGYLLIDKKSLQGLEKRIMKK